MSGDIAAANAYAAARAFIARQGERLRNAQLGMLAIDMELDMNGMSADPAMSTVFNQLLGSPKVLVETAYERLGEFLGSELSFVEDADVIQLVNQVRNPDEPGGTAIKECWLDALRSIGVTPPRLETE